MEWAALDFRMQQFLANKAVYCHWQIGQFSLQVQQRGDEWDWSICHSQYEIFMAFGTAPTLEVAESVIEEIIGQKPAWSSRAA
jgi:hypothetical protein